MPQTQTLDLDIDLHDKQGAVLQSQATEILYGGAAGGGKSHLMRVLAIMLCLLVPGLQVYLFRRKYPDLMKNHMEGPSSFLVLLAPLMLVKLVKHDDSKNRLRFWNGSTVHLCHLQHEKDIYNYQGAEIHVLLMDELTHFTEKMYRYLRGRTRMIGMEIPKGLELVPGVFAKDRLPLVLCGSNPGGIGHNWVKRMFVDMCPALAIKLMPKAEGGMLRQYIPALLEDNPTLLRDDPEYVARLEGLGDPALVKAMRTGDWNIVAGGALDDVWTPQLILPRFPIPKNWYVDRAFDWGSSHPFSVGWYAMANGEEVELPDGRVLHLPSGSLIRFAEWYGSKEVGSNAGLKMSAPDIAIGILAREQALYAQGWVKGPIYAGPADSSIYDTRERDVDSIAKKMEDKGVYWVKANKAPGSRINGLELMRSRMKAVARSEGAGLYFTENCVAAQATLPTLPRDERNLEDVDTKAEDHVYDEVRYRVLAGEGRLAHHVDVRFPQ